MGNLPKYLNFRKRGRGLVNVKQHGLILNLVPKEGSIISLNKEYQLFSKNLGASIVALFLSFKIILLINRILFAINNKTYKNNAIAEQQGWKYLKKSFTKLPKKYDTSIGFLEKSSIYFSIDLVNATNKIGFIHNDYNKLGLNKSFDQNYFQKLHKIVTVSQECAHILKQEFSNQANKVVVMHNIVSVSYTHLDVYKRQVWKRNKESQQAALKLVQHILDTTTMTICFTPHVIIPNNDDYKVLEEFYNHFKHTNRVILLPNNLNACLLYTSRCE